MVIFRTSLKLNEYFAQGFTVYMKYHLLEYSQPICIELNVVVLPVF